jgi:hypothetical protein
MREHGHNPVQTTSHEVRVKLKVLAALGLVALAGFYPVRAVSRSASKIQLIYQGQTNGEWQVFLFGAPPCGKAQNVQVIYPKDSTQPLEIECDNLGGK